MPFLNKIVTIKNLLISPYTIIERHCGGARDSTEIKPIINFKIKRNRRARQLYKNDAPNYSKIPTFVRGLVFISQNHSVFVSVCENAISDNFSTVVTFKRFWPNVKTEFVLTLRWNTFELLYSIHQKWRHWTATNPCWNKLGMKE